MTRPVARVVLPDATDPDFLLGDARASVYAPYELRSLLKSFRGRRWSPERKCWQVPAQLADQVADLLRLAGCDVFVTRQNGTPWESGATDHGHRGQAAPNWAEALFAAVGAERADSVLRALAKVLHPDAGGDLALMQQLNAARAEIAS